MAYQFKAIERDKATIKSNNQKTKAANETFSGLTDIRTLKPGEVTNANIEVNGIEYLSLDQIKPRAVNEFREISNVTLKASILNLGLVTPILVRSTESGKYIVIAGHRRLSVYKEILRDLTVKKAQNTGIDFDDALEKEIEKFSKIPSIIFTIVDDDSELLGTNPKYITKKEEEQIYQATNLEARQVDKFELIQHINYFYRLINEDNDFKARLLADRNKNAKRQATKLNMPDVISQIVTKELGFNVAPTYIWRYVTILESKESYPAYQEICLMRIKNGDPVKTVFNDFTKAKEIFNNNFESPAIRKEYLTRIEKGDEKIVDIYAEVFDIKEVKLNKAEKIDKNTVLKILADVKSEKITLEEAISHIEKS